MTKQEAKDEIRYRECVECIGNELGCGVCAYKIAIECIQECIDREESPCYSCYKDTCHGCLYNGRLD